MPNWCSNYVTFKGETEKIKKVEEFCRGMDFNKIVPMPEELGIISGTMAALALKVFNGDPPDEYELQHLNRLPIHGERTADEPFGERSADLSYLWTKKKIEGEITKEKLIEASRAQEPKSQGDLYELGRIMNDNMKKYNAKDWYDWRYDNWGTKWNASEVYSENKGEELNYSFETPNNPPDMIMEIISEYIVRLSGISMKWSYSIEDCGSGEYVLTEEGLKDTGYYEYYGDCERAELDTISFRLDINIEEYEKVPESLVDGKYVSRDFKNKEELLSCLKDLKLKNKEFSARLITYVEEFDEKLKYVEYFGKKGITRSKTMEI